MNASTGWKKDVILFVLFAIAFATSFFMIVCVAHWLKRIAIDWELQAHQVQTPEARVFEFLDDVGAGTITDRCVRSVRMELWAVRWKEPSPG